MLTSHNYDMKIDKKLKLWLTNLDFYDKKFKL